MVKKAFGKWKSDLSKSNLEVHAMACACPACQTDRADEDQAADPTDGGTASAGSVTTLAEMSEFLATGYWGNGTGLRHNLGTTGPDPNNGVLYYNVSGFGALSYGGGEDANGLTAARAELVRDAFDIYEQVLGIEFAETTSTDNSVVDFFFSDNKSGAYAGSVQYSDGTIYYSYLNIAQNWSGGTSTYDDYTLQTILHEIGHALGLGHQGFYNGTGGYEADSNFELDSWQASMMSYFSQTENTAITASYEFLQTPMAVDWLALDSIYGQFGYGVSNAFTGDTTYGFDTTITPEESRIWSKYADYGYRTASTIVDADGIDTLNVSGYSADQRIDLTVQSATQTYQNTSDIGGRIGNLTLAVGTVIENAVGGSGNDTLIGNGADNILSGGAGNDTLQGFTGNDTFDGGSGYDTVVYVADFSAYTFSLLETAIEVIGEGIDLVYNTIESFRFSDAVYGYTTLVDLFSVNTAPEAVADRLRVAEGAEVTIDVLANDTDADLDALIVTAIDAQSITVGETVTLDNGTAVTLNANGTLTYSQNGTFAALTDGQTGTGSFTYTVSDTGGATDTATVMITVDGETGESIGVDPTAIGQSGVVTVAQSGSAQWHQVTFDAEIDNAVVVMGPMTTNGGQAATVRLRDVTDTGFSFQIDEWDYLDGNHITETIGWLAVSEGSHDLGNGQTVVAGTQTVDGSFSHIDFGESLGQSVVMADVASVNGTDAVTTRVRSVDANGFQVRLQEEEAGGTPVAETVSWIAIEAGISAGVEAVRTPHTVRHQVDQFEFVTDFDETPVLLGDLQTFDGRDTATLRLADLNLTSVSVFVEEEQSKDTEIGHISEVAGYVAMTEGMIFEDTSLV